ncbi:MAG: TRAP transporter permease [Treponema sp.]|nr:TRAP transporter permease [Treponema sp.]MDY5837381.1 TRAP transporter permease [Treponema sp.]
MEKETNVNQQVEKGDNLTPTANEVDLQQLMGELDKEQAYRQHGCWRQYITVIVSILFVAFQLYASLSGRVTAQILRATHLAFVQLLAFLLFPPTKKSPRNKLPWYDIVLGLIGSACWMYVVINFQDLARRTGAFLPQDIIVGVIGILVLMESCRRIVGIPILIIASAFILYAFLGAYLPGFLNHRGYKLDRITAHLFYNTEGIMGVPLGACSTFIFLFILFGALLEKTGIGQFFIDTCNAIAGSASGGPAKVAVLTSALLGTVSGSSVSNTVGSGSFTIPMMKRLGYKSEFAGAVEAAASTGGQLMPPIMGAAAFLMAESLGLPYITIVKASIIPALLYFAGIFITVHLEAHKLGLKGLPREQLPKILPLLLKKGYMILPLVIIVVYLCMGRTAVYAAFMGIACCMLIGLITSIVDVLAGRQASFGVKDLLEVTTAAARNIISVAIACAMAGIIIGIVTLTGIGLKFGAGLISISGGVAIITLVLTMISSIILGMGAPTTANYLITSTITAGAIIGLGFQPLAAHMFAFYFGIIADITPPVALAAIAGAAIAKGKPIKTAFNATKLAIGAFIIPYVFVFNPQMLMIDTSFLSALPIAVTALIGMFGISAALEGYAFRNSSIIERILFAAAGIMCILPNSLTDFIGIFLLIGLIVFQLLMKKFRGAKNA